MSKKTTRKCIAICLLFSSKKKTRAAFNGTNGGTHSISQSRMVQQVPKYNFLSLHYVNDFSNRYGIFQVYVYVLCARKLYKRPIRTRNSIYKFSFRDKDTANAAIEYFNKLLFFCVEFTFLFCFMHYIFFSTLK